MSSSVGLPMRAVASVYSCLPNGSQEALFAHDMSSHDTTIQAHDSALLCPARYTAPTEQTDMTRKWWESILCCTGGQGKKTGAWHVLPRDVMSRFMFIIELLGRNGYGARAGEGFSLVLAPDPVQVPGPQAKGKNCPPLLLKSGSYAFAHRLVSLSLFFFKKKNIYIYIYIIIVFYLPTSKEATSSADQACCREEDSTMSPPSDDSDPDHLVCYFRFNPSLPPGRLPCRKD